MTRCLICKETITQPATGRRKTVCSDRCRQALHRIVRRLNSGKPSVPSSADGAQAGGGDVLASTAATGTQE